MEPFLSRDGQFLFFNDLGEARDVFFASRNIVSGTFTFQAAITGINTTALEGVPTLDDNNRFYYVSTYNYPPHNANILNTIYVGDFEPKSAAVVNNLAVVPNLDEGILGHLNFDVEVSPDGRTLYLVDGIFSGNSYPDESNFIYAVDSGSGFVRQANSAEILRSVRSNISAPFVAPQVLDNISGFVEAPTLSPDEKELFYHRRNSATNKFELYRVTRP